MTRNEEVVERAAKVIMKSGLRSIGGHGTLSFAERYARALAKAGLLSQTPPMSKQDKAELQHKAWMEGVLWEDRGHRLAAKKDGDPVTMPWDKTVLETHSPYRSAAQKKEKEPR